MSKSLQRYLGCFVSSAGGLYKALERGGELGVNTIMMHPSPPQRWCTKHFEKEQIEKFNERKRGSGIEKVFLHGIYLINLATPDKRKLHLAKIGLVYYLDLCEQIQADGVIFHVGSLKDTSEIEGFKQIMKGVDWILGKAEGRAPLLLEVSAGAGNVIGDRFKELAEIRSSVKQKDRVFYCLDAQHMFASGYDLVNDLEGVVKEAEDILGLDRIKAIHFNDSKVPFASNKDRHADIGEGLIGEEALKNFLSHPKLRHVPFILETPAMKEMGTAKREVGRMMEWAGRK